MAKLADVTDATFVQEVEASDVPVLVDFWAPWCGPCRMVGPVLERVSQEREGTLKVVKMDIDENPGVASRLNIRSIPSMLLFKDGKVAGALIGAVPKSNIDQMLDAGLSS